MQGQAGTNGADDLSELLGNRPDAVNPIIGYNVLPASYNLAALTPGRSLDTTDTAKSGNTVQGVPETLVVNVTSNSGTGAQVSHCMLGSYSMRLIELLLDFLCVKDPMSGVLGISGFQVIWNDCMHLLHQRACI